MAENATWPPWEMRRRRGKMAQKPKAPEWLFDRIDEASKNTRKIYFLYMGLLAYCALTIVSTSDRQIILNETATLPILKLDVPLNGFFILAPLIAILVFIYFQLYLHRLKGLIVDLRTNYAPIEKRRLYPWIINIAEDPEPGTVGALQKIIVSFSLWTSLILVLILFALWYVKTHEPIWSYVVGSAPIVGCMVIFWFWLHYEPGKLRKSTWRKVFSFVGFSFVISFELWLFLFLIPWAREGGKYEWIRPFICVNLSYQDLVTEPKKDYKGLFWGNFNEARLEGARLINSVLERANLKNANLNNALLRSAILEEANLEGAKLQGADLRQAKLQGADLTSAELQRANLFKTKLNGAKLLEAKLQKAKLADACLEGADLTSANLEGADLTCANLEKANLYKTKLQGADLSKADLKGAKLGTANLQKANLEGAKLQGADLKLADLQGANLEGAEFQGANLWEAKLQGADLRKADFQEAKYLTADQLYEVETLYDALLPPKLKEPIRKYPHLLEKPKEK
jgi:uncharacterized protein YjbI with pentapeptide repeats